MSLLDVFRGNGPIAEASGSNQIAQLSSLLRAEQDTNLMLTESLADMELMLEDQGWERLLGDQQMEFSRNGLNRSAQLCRLMAVGNPLIKRGLNVRQAYVFGDGVEIEARDQDVNEIVQAFLNDKSNKASISGSQAEEENERSLGTDGNIFFACFTTPKTGRVEVRTLPFMEITDIITNPEDQDEPWYYERTWTEQKLNADGYMEHKARKAYYPDLNYRPSRANKLSRINGKEVIWNAPVYHVSVNRLNGWRYGIGDAFAAIAWARSYKEFLEDWATLMKALSRFAWKASHKKVSGAQKLREKLRSKPSVDPDTGKPLDVGGTAVTDDETTLEAIPKTGAVIDSNSGKPLAAMVASALEISLIVLLTDPGATGARAVAETLDEPMTRAMNKRRRLWQEAYEEILNYVMDAAVKAGKLRGSVVFDKFTRRELTILRDEDARTLDFDWPELGSIDTLKKVQAIVEADSTNKIPPLQIAKLLLRALGVEDVDEILKDMVDDDGNFKDPNLNATLAAVRAFRQGQDGSNALNQEEPPDDDEEDEEE